MKIAWSVLVGDARGSVGSITATLSRSGPVMRALGTQYKPNSPEQIANRAAFSSLSKYWRTPDMDTHRAGWIYLAINHFEEDVFHHLIKKTGSQWFVRCNKNRQTLGLDPVLPAPTFAAVADPGIVTLTHDTSPAEAMTVTCGTPTGANDAVVIRATRGLSPGRLTIGNEQRIVFTLNPGGGLSWDILAAYTTKFKAPVAGTQIMVQVTYTDTVQGRAGLTETASCIW